jgi:hypothetical protein
VKNTRSDHPLQDNSLQTRTGRLLHIPERRQRYNKSNNFDLFHKPLFLLLVSSHPTQDFVLQIFSLDSGGYSLIFMSLGRLEKKGVSNNTPYGAFNGHQTVPRTHTC